MIKNSPKISVLSLRGFVLFLVFYLNACDASDHGSPKMGSIVTGLVDAKFQSSKKPTIQNLTRTPSKREVSEEDIIGEIRRGSPTGLCRKYARGMHEWGVLFPTNSGWGSRFRSVKNFCGVPIPKNDNDFKLINWETIPVLENANIAGEIYYWSQRAYLSPRYRNQWYENHGRFNSVGGIIGDANPSLLQDMWGPHFEAVLDAEKKNIIKLQRVKLDLNFDGTDETIYRMTAFGVEMMGSNGKSWPKEKIQGWHDGNVEETPEFEVIEIGTPTNRELYSTIECQPWQLPGENQRYNYLVYETENREISRTIKGRFGNIQGGWLTLFSWRNRVYWWRSGVLYEPYKRSNGGVSLKGVCEY